MSPPPAENPPVLHSVRLVALLTCLVALGPVSIDIFLPSLPAISVAFAADPAQTQLAVTLFILSMAISQLVYGPLSDRYGRKKVILGGLTLYTLAGVGCFFAQGLNFLVTARVLQGLAVGSGQVVGRAVVRDVYSPAEGGKILSYMTMATSLALITAPITGGLLLEWFGWRSVFITLAGLGAVITLLVFSLPETNRHMDHQATRLGPLLRNMGTLLKSPIYTGYAFSTTFRLFGIITYLTGASFVLIEHLHLSPRLFGLTFGITASGMMCGSFLSTRLSLGIGPLVMMGSLVSAFSAGTMALLAWSGHISLGSILVPMFLTTLGMGMAMPHSMAGAIAPFPKMAGLATAGLGLLQMGGGALLAMAFARFQDGSPLPMVTGVAIGFGCSLLTLLVLRPHRRPLETER